MGVNIRLTAEEAGETPVGMSGDLKLDPFNPTSEMEAANIAGEESVQTRTQ